MSRLGKMPIKLSPDNEVEYGDNVLCVRGKKGELTREIKHPDIIKIVINNEEIRVELFNSANSIKKDRAFWGLYRSLINNMVIGVNEGFNKKLEINGIGYKVSLSGRKFLFNVGFSHQVEFELPDNISGSVEGNVITVEGIDKCLVGQTAAKIRDIKKPEPYKGKGIKYLDEIIRRKAGKTASK